MAKKMESGSYQSTEQMWKAGDNQKEWVAEMEKELLLDFDVPDDQGHSDYQHWQCVQPEPHAQFDVVALGQYLIFEVHGPPECPFFARRCFVNNQGDQGPVAEEPHDPAPNIPS